MSAFNDNRLLGLAHHLDAQPEDLLGPLSAPTPVAGVHPQVLKARKLDPRGLQHQLDAILVVYPGAVYLGSEHQTFSIHQQVPLAAADLLLAPVVASLLSAHSAGRLRGLGVHDIPALGCGSLPTCDCKCSRSPAFRCFHVPSMRHLLNQS